MKRGAIVLLCAFFLMLFGCKKEEETKEYILFKSELANGMEHAYTLSSNQWITEETLTKLKEDPSIEIDDAYLFPNSYHPNGDYEYGVFDYPIEWNLKLNGKEIANTETGLGKSTSDSDFTIPYQYSAIAPFKDIDKLESYCAKKYMGEIKEYIPIYLSNHSLLVEKAGLDILEDEFTDEVLLTVPIMVPESLKNGVYEMKRVDITFQLKGLYISVDAYYDYIPLENMNRLIESHKKEEISPMSYIITTNSKKANEIKTMEENIYIKPRWNDTKNSNVPAGILND